MARLIVDAVAQESKSIHDDSYVLLLFASVSHSETGAPIQGLTAEHFRVCSPLGAVFEMNILGSQEVDWEPADTDPAGCYSLRIARKWAHTGELSEWNKLEASCFGLQVRVPGPDGTLLMGQTTLRQESLLR